MSKEEQKKKKKEITSDLFPAVEYIKFVKDERHVFENISF